MPQPVDLLLITYNRHAYLEKAIPQLVEDRSDFRVYWWDNHSSDGAVEVVRDLADERFVRFHASEENVRQGPPTRWFLAECSSDVVGKIDDDVLLPAGWTERFAPLVRSHPKLGMLGCWMFMPEDYDERQASQNFVTIDGHRIFRTLRIGGCSFVVRKELLESFLSDRFTRGIPVDRVAMSLAGYVSGYPLPLQMAHHMDDPRSSHCLMHDSKHSPAEHSFTMRNFGFETLEEYGRWIAEDARTVQQTPYEEQLRLARLERDPSLLGRVRRRWRRVLARRR
jgi:glycosyltransferase involved in cell wall biosynthesis